MHNFYNAIHGREKIAVIAELKRASPSHGPFPAHNIKKLMAAYKKGGASAISVVTEPKRFGGSLALLKEVRAHTTLPIIRKDFLTTTHELDETREARADAVLLIAHNLSDAQLAKLARHALKIGLTPVIEVHSHADVKKIMPLKKLKGIILGVNNRNLVTLATDVHHSTEILPLLPKGVPCIAESAFASPASIDEYRGTVDAILIGTTFLTAKDPQKKVAEFVKAGMKKTRERAARVKPDATSARVGYYGDFGGAFVPELLTSTLKEVSAAFEKFTHDRTQQAELKRLLTTFAGRQTPLFFAKNLSRLCKRKIYLKREDLLHGGAHKTNNTVGQGLLAKYMGKKMLIAETGAGQHGVAVALVGALLKMKVKIFMGARDVERQSPNVQRMQLLGAEVVSVQSGSKTLKDAINDAMRFFVANAHEAYYLFGTVAGPHPFPAIVRHFQSIIGTEARAQILKAEGKLPTHVVACVGGGSNAIGIFSGFLNDKNVELIGVEAAGGATLQKGSPAIVHGSYSYCMQDTNGQIMESHSISAGLDYPGVGPEHSMLKESGRVTYKPITDAQALDGFQLLCREEGIIPALESSHAIAHVVRTAHTLPKNALIIINLSGRGDKDLTTVLNHMKLT